MEQEETVLSLYESLIYRGKRSFEASKLKNSKNSVKLFNFGTKGGGIDV